jgi:hypothetical protein
MTIFPNITTTITITNALTNATISVPPNGLSDGAIAGIVIGTIVGVIGLFVFAFLIYKYRQRFVDMLPKGLKQSNSISVPVS